MPGRSHDRAQVPLRTIFWWGPSLMLKMPSFTYSLWSSGSDWLRPFRSKNHRFSTIDTLNLKCSGCNHCSHEAVFFGFSLIKIFQLVVSHLVFFHSPIPFLVYSPPTCLEVTGFPPLPVAIVGVPGTHPACGPARRGGGSGGAFYPPMQLPRSVFIGVGLGIAPRPTPFILVLSFQRGHQIR